MPTTVTRRDRAGNVLSTEPLRLNGGDGYDVANDSNLPSYTGTKYEEIHEHLMTCSDAYTGSTAWLVNGEITNPEKAIQYLPKESQEQDSQYANRVRRSLYRNAFKTAIKGFAGLLSDFELSEDAVISEDASNVDRQSSSLSAFLCDADELVLRDGMCGILIDYPPRPEVDNAAEEQALDLRPYLILIERKDILNWKFNSNGALERVTIRSVEMRPMGLFGEEAVTVYHVWMPGLKQIWEEQKYDGEKSIRLVDEIPVSLEIVPFVPYSITSLHPFECMPPMLDLALMNFHHYRLYSDYMEVMHKCNLPVPVRKGYMPVGTMDNAALPPVVIGPNTAIDVPVEGDFFFAEPSGAAIGATRQAIIDVEEAMMQESLNFLGNAGEKTKYEVQLRSSQSRASLSLLAEQKESAVQQIFMIWGLWEGIEEVGGIEISRDLLAEKIEPVMVQILSDMQTQGQLPLDEMLNVLKARRVLPKELDVEAIAQRVNPIENQALNL